VGLILLCDLGVGSCFYSMDLIEIWRRLGREYQKEWDIKIYSDEDGIEAELIQGLTREQKDQLVWILSRYNIKYHICEVVRKRPEPERRICMLRV